MTMAWNWIRTEYRLLGALERMAACLKPPELVVLPNYQSLISEMVLSRGVTMAGDRFSPYIGIDTLLGHPLGIMDDVVCLWMQTNENPLLPELAGHLSGYFETR